MAVRIENDCVGCPQGCINCGLKRAKHYYCDRCKDEFETIYHFEGEELCIECIEELLHEVE